jgi:hypothetical protein
MSPRVRFVGWTFGWAGAAFGALALERIPGHYENELCGPWGCMPPLQALAAMHGFWLVLLLPPTAWMIARASPVWLWSVGTFALWIGIFGLVAVTGRGLTTWLETTGGIHRYAGQRLLYVAVTSTDLPFGQLAVAGVVLWLVGRRRIRCGVRRPTDELAATGVAELSLEPGQQSLSRCMPHPTGADSANELQGAS